MKKYFTFSLLIFLAFSNVSAASSCNYKEQTSLNSKAANVKVSYEKLEKPLESDEINDLMADYFKVSIANVTEDLYVIAKNDADNSEVTYTYADSKDGIITFDWNKTGVLANYTFYVYSSEKTSCPGEKYKTLYLTLPVFNPYSNLEICSEYPDFYYCKEYITSEIIDNSAFYNKLEKYAASNGESDNGNTKIEELKNNGVFGKILYFIIEYKYYEIGALVLIGGTVFAVKKVKTKKQRELGL